MARADSWAPPVSDGAPRAIAFLSPIASALPGLRLPLAPPSLAIGRDSSNDLCLPDDEWVSRRHCVIHVLGSLLLIEDRSRNGTLVDGQRVHGLTALRVPSSILVGQTVLEILPADGHAPLSSSDETLDSEIPFLPGVTPGVTGPREIESGAEALLLVDMVESTSMVMDNERAYVELVLAMGRILERSAMHHAEPLLTCTGDGFCAAFPTASAALRAAADLDSWARSDQHEAVRLSIALHWGAARWPTPGGRTGPGLGVLSELERLRRDVPSLREEVGITRAGSIVLMTDAFREGLEAAIRAEARFIGRYPLRGLDEPMPVHRWDPRTL